MNLRLSEYIEERGEGNGMRRHALHPRGLISDGGAALILWFTFAAGCAVGAVWAGRISAAASDNLKQGLDLYIAAAGDGLLRINFWHSLRDVLPWTVLAVVFAAFVSCGVTLPLLLFAKGCTLAYTVSSVMAVYGTRLGLLTAGALCGAKNLFLLLALALAAAPNFTRTLRRERQRGGRRLYTADDVYWTSALLALFLTLVAVAADLYVTPALTALLAR